MKQKSAAMTRPTFAEHDDLERPCASAHRPRLCAASMKFLSTKVRLKNTPGRPAANFQGQVADHHPEARVEHGERPQPHAGEQGVEDAVVREEYLPGIDAHEVAREEGNDHPGRWPTAAPCPKA